MNPDPEDRPQPDGAARDEFDAIVSAWRREGEVPEWPAEAAPPPGPGLSEPSPPPAAGPPADPPTGPPADPGAEPPVAGGPPTEPVPPVAPEPSRPADPTADDAADPGADDEHFVPPEPPPLPRLGAPAFVGLGLMGLGLVLLLVPGWIVPEPYGLPLGLVGLASGLGWLVLRLWPDPSSRDGDDDDGAVV